MVLLSSTRYFGRGGALISHFRLRTNLTTMQLNYQEANGALGSSMHTVNGCRINEMRACWLRMLASATAILSLVSALIRSADKFRFCITIWTPSAKTEAINSTVSWLRDSP